MTLDELEVVEQQIEELGITQSVMVLSRETAESIVDGKDLTPLMEFAKRHHIALKFNRKAAPGIVYRSDAD